jgi:hypothetical protein
MLEGGWLQVLQRIPSQYLDTISLVSVTGAEIVIQQVFRIEGDFIVVRARTAGTLDGGRVMVVPYSQVDFLAFNRKMGEDEVMAIFGAPFQPMGAAVPAAGAATPVIAPVPYVPPPAPAAAAAEAEAAELPEAAASDAARRPNQISKSILLARLRERLAEKSK